MPRAEPEQIWWTAEELVAASLPEMPGTARAINLRAEQLGWRSIPGAARTKRGRGGGWQYHWSLLPKAAQRALLIQDVAETETRPDRGAAWAAFDALPQRVKDKAADRLRTVQTVERMVSAGLSQAAAVTQAALLSGISARTVYNWLEQIEGVRIDDRLAYLAPRHRMARRDASTDKAVEPFMEFLKSLYLRIAGQTFRQCHRVALKEAKRQGWVVLKERTAYRRVEREVPHVTRVFAREGVAGLEKCFPAQIRDRSGLVALEAVNADCHKIDVFVEWPCGKIDRPQIVAFQDLYSNKILSWRVDHDPNKVMVMAAFGELVETWGIPRRCLFDNGREFANKWFTGGMPTRFRFKVREDDPLGVLALMDIAVTWARPASGQSKPIERGFGDLANDIAKDVRFHGAYVGKNPQAKPENYRSRAIPLETFLAVLDEGIAEHNAREGRLTDNAAGRSFDRTFSESYADAPIRKATEEQRRLWMMAQQVGKLNSLNGQLRLFGNYYHSDWMSQHPGLKVVARFDPDALHEGMSIYAPDGAYLGFAECRQKVGFFSLIDARRTAKRKARIQRAERELAKAVAPLSPAELADRLTASAAPAAAEALSSKVVAPEFRQPTVRPAHRGATYSPTEAPEIDAARDALIMNFPDKRDAPAKANEGPTDRFWRARDLLDRSTRGETLGAAEARWVKEYVETAEYQGLALMFELHGKDGVG